MSIICGSYVFVLQILESLSPQLFYIQLRCSNYERRNKLRKIMFSKRRKHCQNLADHPGKITEVNNYIKLNLWHFVRDPQTKILMNSGIIKIYYGKPCYF